VWDWLRVCDFLRLLLHLFSLGILAICFGFKSLALETQGVMLTLSEMASQNPSQYRNAHHVSIAFHQGCRKCDTLIP
jgi:hypothetical protein